MVAVGFSASFHPVSPRAARRLFGIIVSMDTRAQTRLLIPDLDLENQIFTDTEIDDLLGIWDDNPLRAAASAMLAIANDTAKLVKVRTDDLDVDSAATANALRANAKLLFDQADAADARSGDEAFTLVYPDFYPPLVPEATARPWYL